MSNEGLHRGGGGGSQGNPPHGGQAVGGGAEGGAEEGGGGGGGADRVSDDSAAGDPFQQDSSHIIRQWLEGIKSGLERAAEARGDTSPGIRDSPAAPQVGDTNAHRGGRAEGESLAHWTRTTTGEQRESPPSHANSSSRRRRVAHQRVPAATHRGHFHRQSDDARGEEASGEEASVLAGVIDLSLDMGFADLHQLFSLLEVENPHFRSRLNEVFYRSVQFGMQDVTEALVKVYRAEIDFDFKPDDESDTSLIVCARLGHVDLANFLLRNGASPLPRNISGDSALDVACTNGDKAFAHALLCSTQHSKMDRVKYKEQDFHLGVVDGRGEEEVKKVLYSGFLAATERAQESLVQLFIRHGVDVNLNMDDDLGTPLHSAVEAGCVSCVDALLSAGADVEAVTRSVQQTPLMRACESGHPHVVRRLLEKGAKIDRVTEMCSSALTIACHFGKSDCAKALLENGADPHLRNPWGYTPLFMATDSPEIVGHLLNAGVRVDDLCGERGEAAIHLAAVIGSTESMQRLLAAGSDINIRTFYNETPLWLAAWKGHEHACRMLLQRNCALDAPSNGCQVYAWDYIPVEIAMGLGNFVISKMIVRAGCALRNHIYYGENETGSMELLPWIRLRPEPLELLQNAKAELEWFKEYVTNPLSLKHRTRLAIRAFLGSNVQMSVRTLPIPKSMMSYLCLEDL